MNPGIQQRVDHFCQCSGVGLPVLLAPMAGACPVSRSPALADRLDVP